MRGGGMKYLLNQKYTNGSFQQMHQTKKETKRGNKTNQIIKKKSASARLSLQVRHTNTRHYEVKSSGRKKVDFKRKIVLSAHIYRAASQPHRTAPRPFNLHTSAHARGSIPAEQLQPAVMRAAAAAAAARPRHWLPRRQH